MKRIMLIGVWGMMCGIIEANWFKQHAAHMFQQHGPNVTLIYEHPQTVADFGFMPSLINEPGVVVGALQSALKGNPNMFAKVDGSLNKTRFRRLKFYTYSPGMCFCCYHSGNWNSKWKGYIQHPSFYAKLGNYSACSNRFYLYGSYNKSYQPETDLNETSLGELYPEYPMFTPNYTESGSICSGLMARDPNLWFYFNGWATNYHPGTYQCVGIGYMTIPVQVFLPGRPKRAVRRRRNLVGPLGSQCEDLVIVGGKLAKTEASRVGGGLITGVLTLGSYPGIIAQENRKSILGLTCRLEKTINATGKLIRALQQEIEELNQLLLQHRMALDYLLARKGGFCSIVKGGCKVTFHDLNKTIEDEIQHLQGLIQNNDSGIGNPWDWLTSWLPDFGWLKTLFLGIIVLIVGGFLMMICISCAMKCVRASLSEAMEGKAAHFAVMAQKQA